MEPSFYPEDLVVGKSRNGKIRYGVIDLTPDMDSDEFDSDYDFVEEELAKGFVRLSWYPEGKQEKVHESKLQLVDRSALPCDVVREKNGKQLGTVVQVEVTCNGMIVGTTKTINNIAAKTLKFINPFMPGDIVSFGPWLGRVVIVYSGVVVVFPSGAKGQIPLDSKGSELLEDQFPHITNEGSFYDDDCAYYPGQVLTGTAKAFRDIIWLDEKRTVQLKPKSRHKVVVEQVTLFGLKIRWGQRSFSDSKIEAKCLGHSGVVTNKSSDEDKSSTESPPDATVNFKDLDVDVKLDWDSKTLNLKFVQGLTPPMVIAGRMLKKVKRLMHFWTGNVHMGERYQYRLTAEDVAQLSTQGKLTHPKKRTRRNIAARRANRKRLSSTKTGDRSSKTPKKLKDDSSQTSTQESNGEEDSSMPVASGNTKGSGANENTRANDPPSFEATHSNAEETEEQAADPADDDSIDTDDSKDITELLKVWISHKDLEPMNKYLGSKASQLSEFTWTFTNPEYALRQAVRECSPLEVLRAFKRHCLKSIPSTRQVGHKMEYRVGQYVTVDICSTSTLLEVEWQDGTVSRSLPSKDITQAHHIDHNDFCPGDFVCDERSANDMYRYGVVLKADSGNRMVEVQWFSLDPNHNKVETLEKEELSAYEVSDHPDFNFRISDILVRLSAPATEQDSSSSNSSSSSIGELLRVMPDGRLYVIWSDGSTGHVHPHELMRVGGDGDEDTFWNAANHSDDSSGDSDSSGWEMEDSEGETAAGPEIWDPPAPKRGPSGEPKAADSPVESEKREKVKETVKKELMSAEIEDSEDVPAESTAGNSKDSSNGWDFPSFSTDPSAPDTHRYRRQPFLASDQKSFMKALRRDIKLFKNSLPPGIYVKVFEDRMDLLSVLILGPENTPYEDGVFAFEVQLPGDYPAAPPRFHYVSYSHRLNPNLYEDGKVCVSLLGTWMGKGNEKWTRDSNLLQVLISIQGLILNSEPYYNEAGYEGHRGTAEGQSNSRCYNEMVILRLVEHTAAVLFSPPRPFVDLCRTVCPVFASKLVSRVEALLAQGDGVTLEVAYPLLPLSKGVLLSLRQKLERLESTLASLKDSESS